MGEKFEFKKVNTINWDIADERENKSEPIGPAE
jgi:hypothetical protein